MAITKVGTRYRGEKIDRVVDSLGSDADGTNSGVTITGGKIARPSGASWDFSNILYSGKNYNVSSKENQPATCTFKTDGTKFYVVGEQNATIYEFTCSTAWDVSTASYTTSKTLQKTTNYGGNTPQNCGIAFKSDGTKCFVCERNDETIHEYALSSAWDISTLNTTHTDGFSVSSQTSNPRGIWVNSDGTKFYVPSTMNEGSSNDTVFQYTCSTGWDLTTASYASKSKDYSSKIANGVDFAFNNDGTKCYVLNIDDDGVFQFTVDTAYDVTTIDLTTSEFLNTNAQDSTPLGFYIEPTQKKIFVVGLGNDKVSQYSDEYYGAYSFDGTNDYVSTTETGLDFQASDSFTVAFWFKTTDTGEAGFVSRWNTSNNGWLVLKDTGTTASFRLSSNWGGGNAIRAVATNNAFSDGNWHHLAVTYGGSGHSSIKMYVDGTAQTLNVNLTGTVGTITYGTNLAFGVKEATGSFSDKYDGELDDIGIWKRELTATEINKLANNNGHTRSTYRMGGLITAKNNLVFSAPTGQRGGYTSGYGGDTTIWDLGQTLSANFVARFELKLDNYSINSNWQASNGFGLWLSNNESDGIDTAQQWITLVGHWAQNGSGYIGTKTSTSAPENMLTSSSGISSNSATTYYCQLTKNGDNITFTRTTNSDYTTGTSSHAITGGNSVSGLRYLKLSGTTEYRSGQFPNGTVDGQITNLKIDDNTTTWSSADITPTVDNPAQLVSSLTNKSGLKAHYTMDSTDLESLKGTADYTEDFSGSDNWADSDSSKIGVNTTDNDLDFNMIRDGSNDACVYDLQHADALNGSNANDTKWALRFKINFSAISGGSGNGNDIWIGLSDKDESAGSTTSQDFIGIDMNMDNTNVMRSATTNDSTFPLGAGSSTVNWTPSTSTDYYVQIIRTSSTNATIDIFSDSSYSTKEFTTLSYSVSSSTQSLRYIKIANRVNSGGGRTITGIIDDVKFYNNSASLDGCKNDFSSTSNLDGLSGIKSGSVFLQTNDTPKYYWYDGTSWKIDGTTAFLPSGSGLHVGGSSSNTSTFTATDYVWASSSVSTIGESRSYSSGAGNKNSFWIAGGSNAHTSRIFNGSSWSSTTALDTERRDTTAGGGSTSNAIIACGRNQSTTELSSSSKYNGTSWSSAGTVTGGAGEHVGGSGTASSFLATGGSTRNDKCDKYDGTSWSASAVLPQTTVRSHNQAGKSSASAHTAGGNYASSFTWDGTSWATSTNYTQGGDTTVRYPTGGGTADHHWLMGGLDETGGTSTLNNTELWNGSSWTAKGALPTGNYAGLGDGSDF